MFVLLCMFDVLCSMFMLYARVCGRCLRACYVCMMVSRGYVDVPCVCSVFDAYVYVYVLCAPRCYMCMCMRRARRSGFDDCVYVCAVCVCVCYMCMCMCMLYVAVVVLC